MTKNNAARKGENNKFLIDAISTDGGGYPRNYIVDRGLALVGYGALSLEEFVYKSSVNPAEMFGLKDKGHLGEGADGDLTVLDIDNNEAVLSISRGEISMIQGIPVGERGTVITTKEGLKGMASSDFSLEEAKIKDGLLYR